MSRMSISMGAGLPPSLTWLYEYSPVLFRRRSSLRHQGRDSGLPENEQGPQRPYQDGHPGPRGLRRGREPEDQEAHRPEGEEIERREQAVQHGVGARVDQKTEIRVQHVSDGSRVD